MISKTNYILISTLKLEIGSKNDNKIIQNSLGLYCIFDILKMKHHLSTENKIVEKQKHNIPCQFVDAKTILRRQFLLNLKNYLNQKDITINTLYTHNIIKHSIFLDVEYTNDIYDDFSTFPISKDTSLLFIIGISRVVNNESRYTDFTSRRLTWQEEYRILNDFLNYIQNDKPILIFHWSHADKYIIEKSLARYPDLQEKYKFKQIVYVDLLIILKQTISLPSYSLKYVAKELLKLHYDTDCQNGLDAMCNIIQNDIILYNKGSNKDLLSLPSSKDVVKYNKIDTTLLYDVLKYFIS